MNRRNLNPDGPRRRAFSLSCALLLTAAAVCAGGPGAARAVAQGGVAGRPPFLETARCGAFMHPKNDREGNCLRGQVRVVETELTLAGDPRGRRVIFLNEFYDERGGLTKLSKREVAHGTQDYVESGLVYDFDGQGRPTGYRSYRAGEPGPRQTGVYTYDERGNRIRHEDVRPDLNQRTLVCTTFDAEGRKVEESRDHVAADGGWSQRVTYTYEGNTARHLIFDRGGALIGKGLSTYDGRGNRVVEEQYNVLASGETRLWRKVTYRFDEKGLEVARVYHKAEARQGARVEFAYDERLNATAVTSYGRDGAVAYTNLFRYEYDARGNWVERISLYQPPEGGEPQPYRVERRRIVYY